MELSAKKILSYVIAAHLVLGLSLFADWRIYSSKQPEKLIVKTVRLSHLPEEMKKTEFATAQPKTIPEKKEIPKNPPAPQKIKQDPPKPKASSLPSKKPPPQLETDMKKKKLLQEAKDKIAKIDMAYDTLSSLKKINGKSLKASELRIDLSNASEEEDARYITEVASILQSALRLPESGDVALNLKLDRTGKVIEVGILSSASERNETYVKTNLPKLHFPAFDKEFRSEKQHTFHLTLSDIKL